MAEQNATVPMDKRIEFRIGINVGDIVVEDGGMIAELTIPIKSGISTVLANAEKFMAISISNLTVSTKAPVGNDDRRPDCTGRIGRRVSWRI